jgi:hypothetical protein
MARLTVLFGRETLGQARHIAVVLERSLLIEHARRVRPPPLPLAVPV